MVKRALIAAVTAASVLTLGGVALGAPSHRSHVAKTSASGIVFSGWGDEEAASKPIFNWMMGSFAKKTSTKVSWVGWPYQNTLQQLVLRDKAKQAPDIAQLDMNWVTTFSKLNALVDLNKVFGKANLEKLISPTLLKLGQRDGKQVALPWTTASIALVANTDLLKKAGITTMPTTTAEFAADLQKIKTAEPDVIPYALDTKTAGLITPFLEPWLWTFGGAILKNGKVAINSPGTVAALTYLSDLISKGLIAKDVDIFDARTLFAQGKVAFYDDAIIARSVAQATDKSFGANVLPVPRPVVKSGQAPQSEQWGHVLVLFKKSAPVTASSPAAKFMQYLVSPPVALKYFANQSLLPVTKAALKSPQLKKDPYFKIWATITATSRIDETALYANGSQISTVVGQDAQAAYLGQSSPADAAKQIAKDLAGVPIK